MLRPWTALERFIAHVFDFYFGLHENVVPNSICCIILEKNHVYFQKYFKRALTS